MNLSSSTSLAAIILTLKIRLLNCAVRSSTILFRDLIQDARNRTFSGIVLLLCITLVNFSIR